MESKIESIPRLLEALKRAAHKSSANDLYIPLQGKHTHNLGEEPFDLAESLQGFFEFKEDVSSDPKVMLLLGDAGSGKSVFSEQLHQQLWKVYRTGDPIPLRIPLPELEKPFNGAVEEVLTKQSFTEDQIAQLKAQERFIFVVDGYDELHDFQNCYATNHWEQWSAKVLITCRTQALYNKTDWEKYFMPHRGEKPLPLLFRKTTVAPFSKDQISAYVRKYRQLKTAPSINEEDFSKIPGLTELITSPFMLHLAVDVLPDLLAHPDEDQAMTRAKLYDCFMERWFRRQIAKLRETQQLKGSDAQLKQQFWDFCKALATRMHETDVSVIPYPSGKGGGRLFGKQEHDNPWAEFFGPESELVRSACPLRRYGEHQIGFVHASFVNYFNNRAVYDTGKEVANTADSLEIEEEIENEQSTWRSPRSHTVNAAVSTRSTRDTFAFEELTRGRAETEQRSKKKALKDSIHARLNGPLDTLLLADRIKESDGVIKAYLLKIIETSKRTKRFAIGAANAISALVKADVYFNRANLSGIKIPGADISGGFFDEADLSKADLTNVKMRNVWLRKASIKGSQVEGINFGEYPWFKSAKSAGLGYFDLQESLHFLVVSAGYYLELWNTLTGELVKEFGLLNTESNKYTCVKFSPNGQRIVAGTDAGSVLLWQVDTDEQVADLKAHIESVNDVAFSPDGERIVSGGKDRIISIWSVECGTLCKCLWSSQRHYADVSCVVFHQDGQRVISGSMDKTIHIWDPATRTVMEILNSQNSIYSLAFTPDGKRVYVGVSNAIEVWDLETSKLLTTITGPTDIVQAVAISAKGEKLVTGCVDGSIRVWDLTNNKEIAVLRGHVGIIKCVKFCSGDQRIISGSQDNIRTWDYLYERHIVRIRGHSHPVKCVQISPDSNFIVSSGGLSDGTVRLWEALDGKEGGVIFDFSKVGIESREFKKHPCMGWVVFSPDGNSIAMGGGTGRVYRWNVLDKFELPDCGNLFSPVKYIQFSPDGKFIAVCDEVSGILFSTISRTECAKFDDCRSFTFSSDGKKIAVLGHSVIHIFNIKRNRKIRSIQFSQRGDFQHAIFDREDKFLWVFRDCQAYRVDVKTGEKNYIFDLEELKDDKDLVKSCQLIENGKRLIAGGSNLISIVDLSSKKRIAVHKFHAKLKCFSYHEDGLLVIGFEDSCIECWQNIGEDGHYQWQFKWTTAINSPALVVEGLDGTKVTGLSYQNRQLLKQRGAENVPMAHRELKWKTADESCDTPTLKSPREQAFKLGFFKGKSPSTQRKESLVVQKTTAEDSIVSKSSIVLVDDRPPKTIEASPIIEGALGCRGKYRKPLPVPPQDDDEPSVSELYPNQSSLPALDAPITKVVNRGTFCKPLPKIPPTSNTTHQSDLVKDDATESSSHSM